MSSTINPNPYASPRAEEPPKVPSASELKDDRLLVAPTKCTLPSRCKYCNLPATRKETLSDYWWFTWSGLRGVKILSFVCEDHHREMERQDQPFAYLIGAMLVVPGAVYLYGYFVLGQPAWIEELASRATSLLVWSFLLYQLVIRKVLPNRLKSLSIVKANSNAAYLKHAGKPFLDSLADGAEGFLVVDKIP